MRKREIPEIIYHGTTTERLKIWKRKDGSIISENGNLWFDTENSFPLLWAKMHSESKDNGEPVILFVLSKYVENLEWAYEEDKETIIEDKERYLRGEKIKSASYIEYNMSKDRLNLFNGKKELKEQIEILIELCKPLGAYPDYVYIFANRLGIKIE